MCLKHAKQHSGRLQTFENIFGSFGLSAEARLVVGVVGGSGREV